MDLAGEVTGDRDKCHFNGVFGANIGWEWCVRNWGRAGEGQMTALGAAMPAQEPLPQGNQPSPVPGTLMKLCCIHVRMVFKQQQHLMAPAAPLGPSSAH